jgi:hypothetical protein
MRRAGSIATSAAVLAALACADPHVAPGPPKMGDLSYHGYVVLERRDAALNARDADAAAEAYAVDAEVIDAGTGAIVLRGREAIRAAHARFLVACPRARIDVLDRSYTERGRFVTDVERVHCDRPPAVEGAARYEIAGRHIVRVLKQRSPLFER